MKIRCTPTEGTTITNIVQRTIGRAVSLDANPLGPATSDLVGDVFQCLYDTEFEPLKDDDAPRERLVNHALMKWLKNDRTFMGTRNRTAGSLILSLTAGKILYEYLLNDEVIRKALEKQEPPPPVGGGKPRRDKGDKSQKDEGKSDEYNKGVQEAIDRLEGVKNNIIGSQIISNAARKADEEAEKTESFLHSWGIDPGEITIHDVDGVMRLVNQNSSKMEKINKLAGRFEHVCMDALEKTRESYVGQIVDVHRTQDFSLMFAPDLCYLMSPDIPPLLHARYVSDYLSHGLMGFELKSEGKEFGSLFIMVDGSGSMNPDQGGFEIQAKAISIGLARALKKDKLSEKEYKLSTFGASRDPFVEVSSKQSIHEHFEWAQLFHNGGTDFDYAFHHAIQELHNMPSGTDFVFITDGECHLSDSVAKEWKRYKNETDTHLLYVDVSGRDNDELHELSDLYLQVTFDEQGNMDVLAESIAETLATSIERTRLAKLNDEGN